MKRIIHLFLLIFILVPSKDLNSQDDKKSKAILRIKQKFASIVSEATKDHGLFNVYLRMISITTKSPIHYWVEYVDGNRISKMAVSIPQFTQNE